MVNKETRQNITKIINGVRKDIEIVRKNMNEVQNMLYRCSTEQEFANWLDNHVPEKTKYIMLFDEEE